METHSAAEDTRAGSALADVDALQLGAQGRNDAFISRGRKTKPGPLFGSRRRRRRDPGSRDIGLQGRKPLFHNLRQLVWSYFEPYIDMTGRVKGYGLTSLYDLGRYDWRFSRTNMHKIEDHLRAIPHKKLRSSDRRYEFWHERYQKFKQRYPDKSPVYYPNRNKWML